MPNPYSGLAAQILQAYQNQANTQAGYAQGYTGQLQGLADQESQSAMALLEQMGAPEGQQEQAGEAAGGPVGNLLYGQTGYLPAENLGEQGNAFAAYAATLPGLLQQELQQNASYFAAMHQPSGGGSGGGGGGGGGGSDGDSGGLTPSQQLVIQKFEYDQEQDAMKWEFEMMKWEHELDKDRRANKEDDRTYKRLMLALGISAGNTKADNKRADRAENRQRNQDRIDNRQEDQRIAIAQQNADRAAINAANTAAKARGEKAQAYWESLGKGASSIYNDEFPTYKPTESSSGGGGGPGGVAAGSTGGGGTTPTKTGPPEYRVAFRRVMAGMRAQYGKPGGGWKFGFTNKQVKAKVNQVLKQKGIHKKPKPRRRPTPIRHRNPRTQRAGGPH